MVTPATSSQTSLAGLVPLLQAPASESLHSKVVSVSTSGPSGHAAAEPPQDQLCWFSVPDTPSVNSPPRVIWRHWAAAPAIVWQYASTLPVAK